MIQEIVYNGYDNAIWLGLRANKELIDLTYVTRIVITINGTDYDSDILGEGEEAIFDWESQDNVLILRLGSLGVTKGIYNVPVVVYSEDTPNGVKWDTLRLRFK